jgi:hypothetical protein
LTDVRDWPRWTASIVSVDRLDDGPLAIGSRARIRQPRIPPLVWEVTDLTDHEMFSWVAASPGVRSIGRHILRDNGDGTVEIRVELEQHGPLAGLVRALTGRRTRRYLALEAAGLKAACEATDTSAD